MEIMAERFRNCVDKAKASKKSNGMDENGRLVIQPFDKEGFKEWATEQIRYLQVCISDNIFGNTFLIFLLHFKVTVDEMV